jgi:hypothetical protein
MNFIKLIVGVSCVFCFLLGGVAYAQERKSLAACRASGSIKIDGVLNEPTWQKAEKTDFLTNTKPAMGGVFPYPTQVSVAYDNGALYVGAVCYVNAKDRTDRLAARDEIYENTDVFIAYFDTYHDRQNCFSFGVSTGNIQTDFKMAGEGYDGNWDAAWFSEVLVSDTTWVVEMKIPFDAIRFPKSKSQTWGVNFERQVVKKREIAEWAVIDNNRNDYVNMFNDLTGIDNIVPPVRLALLPFVSSYTLVPKGAKTETLLKVGADVKWGINESVTLDATLVPDYKQVRSDRLVYNLGPYEVYYNEQRPFFTEGAELYNKHGEVFYSRRVGSIGSYYDERYGAEAPRVVSQYPQQSNILNASKLTAKLKDGTGIGVFNAFTSHTYVDAACDTCSDDQANRVLYEPGANYAAVVIDQPLANNSFVSFIGTNVTRTQQGHNATVLGTSIKSIHKNGYFVSSKFYNSSVFNRFDARKNIDNGLMYDFNFGRTNRKFGYNYYHQSVGNTFDPNDFGFLMRRNYRSHNINLMYNLPQRNGRFEIQNNWIGVSYSTLYNRNAFTDFSISVNRFNILIWKYFGFGAYAEVHPLGRHDFDETRSGQQYFYNVPPTINCRSFITTNYQKKVAVDVGGGYIKWFGEEQRTKKSVNVSLRLRPGKTRTMIANTELQYYNNQRAFVSNALQGKALFGERNLWVVENFIQFTQVINNQSNVQMEARHYWLRSNYDAYFGLITESGNLYRLAYNKGYDYDVNVNFATVFITYTWRFAPASDLQITYKNDLDFLNPNKNEGYQENLMRLTGTFANNNTLTIRANYYMDYGRVSEAWRKLRRKA